MPELPSSNVSHLQTLFVQHIAAIRGFVFALVPDPHRAADVVQEIFLTVTAKADTFQPGSNFQAWVFAIAKNKAMQSFHRKAGEQSEPLSDGLIESLAEEVEDRFAMHDTRLPHLRACIERLAPQARKMISLRYEANRRPPEISRALKWSLESVNVALSKARAFLRDCVRRSATGEPS